MTVVPVRYRPDLGHSRARLPRGSAAFRKLTLRFRVTLVATAMVAVSLGLAGAGLLLWLEHSMVSGLDSTARQHVDDVVSLVERDRLHTIIPSNGADVDVTEVLGTSGHALASSYIGENPSLTRHFPHPLPAPLLAGHARTLEDLTIGDGGDFRVVARQTHLKGDPVIVIAAVSLGQAERTEHTLATGLVIGCPVLILLVAWTVWHTAGRTLRPVETLRRHAMDISDTDLHRRLGLPASRDEIHALAVTLNEMLTRLEAASLTQRRFVADAAHELRSPLTAIRAQLEVLVHYPDPDRDKPVAAALLDDVQRLHDLVEGLLALARSENPALRWSHEVVDLDEVVLAEVRRQRALTGVGIDASSVSAGRVRGDADALRRVVVNLLDNARRHAAGRIRIELGRREGAIELTVSDDGAGIPAADRQRVFERFTRLDEARSRDTGGSGLGLAIVSHVVAHHGGSVTAHADPAPGEGGLGGARLRVVLPPAEDCVS
jgi:signal transduction histidine kinase